MSRLIGGDSNIKEAGGTSAHTRSFERGGYGKMSMDDETRRLLKNLLEISPKTFNHMIRDEFFKRVSVAIIRLCEEDSPILKNCVCGGNVELPARKEIANAFGSPLDELDRFFQNHPDPSLYQLVRFIQYAKKIGRLQELKRALSVSPFLVQTKIRTAKLAPEPQSKPKILSESAAKPATDPFESACIKTQRISVQKFFGTLSPPEIFGLHFKQGRNPCDRKRPQENVITLVTENVPGLSPVTPEAKLMVGEVMSEFRTAILMRLVRDGRSDTQIAQCIGTTQGMVFRFLKTYQIDRPALLAMAGIVTAAPALTNEPLAMEIVKNDPELATPIAPRILDMVSAEPLLLREALADLDHFRAEEAELAKGELKVRITDILREDSAAVLLNKRGNILPFAARELAKRMKINYLQVTVLIYMLRSRFHIRFRDIVAEALAETNQVRELAASQSKPEPVQSVTHPQPPPSVPTLARTQTLPPPRYVASDRTTELSVDASPSVPEANLQQETDSGANIPGSSEMAISAQSCSDSVKLAKSNENGPSTALEDEQMPNSGFTSAISAGAEIGPHPGSFVLPVLESIIEPELEPELEPLRISEAVESKPLFIPFESTVLSIDSIILTDADFDAIVPAVLSIQRKGPRFKGYGSGHPVNEVMEVICAELSVRRGVQVTPVHVDAAIKRGVDIRGKYFKLRKEKLGRGAARMTGPKIRSDAVSSGKSSGTASEEYESALLGEPEASETTIAKPATSEHPRPDPHQISSMMESAHKQPPPEADTTSPELLALLDEAAFKRVIPAIGLRVLYVFSSDGNMPDISARVVLAAELSKSLGVSVTPNDIANIARTHKVDIFNLYRDHFYGGAKAFTQPSGRRGDMHWLSSEFYLQLPPDAPLRLRAEERLLERREEVNPLERICPSESQDAGQMDHTVEMEANPTSPSNILIRPPPVPLAHSSIISATRPVKKPDILPPSPPDQDWLLERQGEEITEHLKNGFSIDEIASMMNLPYARVRGAIEILRIDMVRIQANLPFAIAQRMKARMEAGQHARSDLHRPHAPSEAYLANPPPKRTAKKVEREPFSAEDEVSIANQGINATSRCMTCVGSAGKLPEPGESAASDASIEDFVDRVLEGVKEIEPRMDLFHHWFSGLRRSPTFHFREFLMKTVFLDEEPAAIDQSLDASPDLCDKVKEVIYTKYAKSGKSELLEQQVPLQSLSKTDGFIEDDESKVPPLAEAAELTEDVLWAAVESYRMTGSALEVWFDAEKKPTAAFIEALRLILPQIREDAFRDFLVLGQVDPYELVKSIMWAQGLSIQPIEQRSLVGCVAPLAEGINLQVPGPRPFKSKYTADLYCALFMPAGNVPDEGRSDGED